MEHERIVFFKCGALHNIFVCVQISVISNFISLGFRILSARTDLLVFSAIALIFSFSLSVFIYTTKHMTNTLIKTYDSNELHDLPDIRPVFSPYCVQKYDRERPAPRPFHRIRSGISDSPEKRTTSSRALDFIYTFIYLKYFIKVKFICI